MPKAARPQNRQRPSAPPPSSTPAWFQIQNLAEPGFAEIQLRGYIGQPKNYRDWWTGEMVEDPEAAGTLAEFEKELNALGNVENLQVSIFSQGGDWATGVAIHNLLIRHPANKICIIDGLCASAATYAAMACEDIRIPTNASMLIHEASNGAYGTAKDHGREPLPQRSGVRGSRTR
jgi:ATP-dependent protease ClpP protease subunit